MGKITDLSDSEFRDFLGKNNLVMVDFFADWCGPCHMLSPVIEKLSEELENVKFAKMDVDQNRETPGKFGILSIPTLLVFKEGKLVDRLTGVLPKRSIEDRLRKFLD
ncbi:MAG: thioredoxin [Candidatus Aenigmarchaeota archaeon]|nr:thioredoxin [Candidatus Aenigmarchaeota archaeon]NIP40562.1 thioredoxin [Candidatus Aenigmarchaeota archaeon]NIQ18407.1 thioredoxin [Candidatus Aenigmarchaeota archaeon]